MILSLLRWRRIAGVAVVSLVAVAVAGIALTNASWNDTEFVAGSTETLHCVGNTDLDSRSAARFLTGTLGTGSSSSLDELVGVTGITVTNDGTTQSAVAGTPGAAVAGSGYAAPLSATAINGALLAGTTVPLPLNWEAGIYQQWGEARDDGWSYSAAGAVSETGAIVTPGPAYPTLSPSVGSLSLSALPGIGGTLGSLTDVALSVGAVSAVAGLDGCSYAWTGGTPTEAQLTRDYLISSLTADLTSPEVAGLFSATGSVTSLVSTSTAAAFGTNLGSGTAETGVANAGVSALGAAVTTSLTSAVSSALAFSLSLLGANLTVDSTASQLASSAVISVDLAPVTTLLSGTTTDGVVTVNLANGRVSVDIGALSGGLNTRSANTELLTDTQVLDITTRVNTLLQARISAITAALTSALDAATVAVNLTVMVKALGIDVLQVQAGYSGTLAQFVAGGPVTRTGPTVSVLGTGAVQTLLVNAGLAGLVQGLLGTITTTTSAVLTTTEALAYDALLGAQLTTLLGTANGLLATAMGVLSPSLVALGNLLAITVNVQPDQAPTNAPLTGEFSVSALRIAATGILDLRFATASVGANAT